MNFTLTVSRKKKFYFNFLVFLAKLKKVTFAFASLIQAVPHLSIQHLILNIFIKLVLVGKFQLIIEPSGIAPKSIGAFLRPSNS